MVMYFNKTILSCYYFREGPGL